MVTTDHTGQLSSRSPEAEAHLRGQPRSDGLLTDELVADP